jgi:hypothetical protein
MAVHIVTPVSRISPPVNDGQALTKDEAFSAID